jgi:dTDP-4-dehydrorhamnose reductase
VRAVLRLAATRDSLRVVADQVGRPTYAKDLANAIARIVTLHGKLGAVPFGLYHATGGPIVSRFQFATEIVQRAHSLRLLTARTPVIAITTAEYPAAARRPANSALLPSAQIAADTGATCDWRSGLERMLCKVAAPGLPS